MLSYKEIKNWFEENKQRIILVVCFVLMFVVGFGAGRFNRELSGRRAQFCNQDNYSTKSAETTIKTDKEGAGQAPAMPKENVQKEPQVLGAAADKSCPVKGNQSSKIYHLPGGAFYETLKSPKCFATEAEAKAAGYRKSGR